MSSFFEGLIPRLQPAPDTENGANSLRTLGEGGRINHER